MAAAVAVGLAGREEAAADIHHVTHLVVVVVLVVVVGDVRVVVEGVLNFPSSNGL